MNKIFCKYCHKEIKFILDRSTGKKIPVNPLTIFIEDVDSNTSIITEQGTKISKPEYGAIGYEPHFQSCRKNETHIEGRD